MDIFVGKNRRPNIAIYCCRLDSTPAPCQTASKLWILKDKNGGEIDRISASSGWPAGDNADKLTMQKISSG